LGGGSSRRDDDDARGLCPDDVQAYVGEALLEGDGQGVVGRGEVAKVRRDPREHGVVVGTPRAQESWMAVDGSDRGEDFDGGWPVVAVSQERLNGAVDAAAQHRRRGRGVIGGQHA